MIETALLAIGLSKKEVKIYLACLKLGPQPAGNIARRTKISRATVYDVFNGLIKKGLANRVERGGTTFFEVLSPDSILRFLEQEKQDFVKEKDRQKKEVSEIIPILKSIEPEKTTKPKVRFFEGKKGLREAYENTLEASGPIRAYANVETMHKALPNFFPDYYDRRTKARIFIRAIMPDNKLSIERSTFDQQENRESKTIDCSEYEFSPEVNIFDDKVLYSSWEEKMGVLIESQEIADFHRKMFDLLWKKIR